ncbi:hypothetical protein F5882DRAFT_508457, partial [Hyaloscypha sp. PMI_1271]
GRTLSLITLVSVILAIISIANISIANISIALLLISILLLHLKLLILAILHLLTTSLLNVLLRITINLLLLSLSQDIFLYTIGLKFPTTISLVAAICLIALTPALLALLLCPALACTTCLLRTVRSTLDAASTLGLRDLGRSSSATATGKAETSRLLEAGPAQGGGSGSLEAEVICDETPVDASELAIGAHLADDGEEELVVVLFARH